MWKLHFFLLIERFTLCIEWPHNCQLITDYRTVKIGMCGTGTQLDISETESS